MIKHQQEMQFLELCSIGYQSIDANADKKFYRYQCALNHIKTYLNTCTY